MIRNFKTLYKYINGKVKQGSTIGKKVFDIVFKHLISLQTQQNYTEWIETIWNTKITGKLRKTHFLHFLVKIVKVSKLYWAPYWCTRLFRPLISLARQISHTMGFKLLILRSQVWCKSLNWISLKFKIQIWTPSTLQSNCSDWINPK